MVGDQSYQDNTLNSIISEYRKNQIYAKEHFEERKREMMEQAADELKRSALKRLEEESQQELEKAQQLHGDFVEENSDDDKIQDVSEIDNNIKPTFSLTDNPGFVSASELMESMCGGCKFEKNV